tara:strand:+ start:114 stop:485 length:372 start_codon:yes stop_codon:yes gene_type:complete
MQNQSITMDMKRLLWKDVELINQLAEKNGYNRQVDIDALKRDVKKNVKSMGYKDFYQIYFAAKEYMIHEHKNGKKCAPHMRIGIWFPDDLHITLDCDLHVWNSFEKIPPQTKQEKRPQLKLVT